MSHGDPVFVGDSLALHFFSLAWRDVRFAARSGIAGVVRQVLHQAYRYGHNVYGLPVSSEVTAEMIADWCAQPVNCGDVDTLTEPIDPQAHDQEAAARQIVSKWILNAGR